MEEPDAAYKFRRRSSLHASLELRLAKRCVAELVGIDVAVISRGDARAECLCLARVATRRAIVQTEREELPVRMMLRVTFPTDLANGAIKGGSFQQVMEAMINKLKPKAAYFMANKGCRCAMLFFDMQDASEIPLIAEPLFTALNGEIELQPVMNPNDLKKGLSAAMQP
jgi:hypothetical protein